MYVYTFLSQNANIMLRYESSDVRRINFSMYIHGIYI
jgi:hypothetical protein